MEKKYEIYNYRTKQVIGNPYGCRKRARNRAEKLDLAYGAYSYLVREIETQKQV